MKRMFVLVLVFIIFFGMNAIFADNSLDAADGNPTDAVYVDDDGDVGIGTTTPAQQLDVRGKAIVQNDSAQINVSSPAVLDGDLMVLNNYSDVEIGKGTVLSFLRRRWDGSDLIKNGATIEAVCDATGSTRTALKFRVASFEDSQDMMRDAMIIKNTGRIGIGTTSPSHKEKTHPNLPEAQRPHAHRPDILEEDPWLPINE